MGMVISPANIQVDGILCKESANIFMGHEGRVVSLANIQMASILCRGSANICMGDRGRGSISPASIQVAGILCTGNANICMGDVGGGHLPCKYSGDQHPLQGSANICRQVYRQPASSAGEAQIFAWEMRRGRSSPLQIFRRPASSAGEARILAWEMRGRGGHLPCKYSGGRHPLQGKREYLHWR